MRVAKVPFLLFSFFFLACSKYSLETKDFEIIRRDGLSVVVHSEVAVTDEEQSMGFMYRKKIPDGTGMLFLFDKDKIARFWMKNTPSALSIAYIDYKGTIRDILHMTPLSEAEVVSSVYVRYALEVPQGWFEKQGIKVGDTVKNLPIYEEEIRKKK